MPLPPLPWPFRLRCSSLLRSPQVGAEAWQWMQPFFKSVSLPTYPNPYLIPRIKSQRLLFLGKSRFRSKWIRKMKQSGREMLLLILSLPLLLCCNGSSIRAAPCCPLSEVLVLQFEWLILNGKVRVGRQGWELNLSHFLLKIVS